MNRQGRMAIAFCQYPAALAVLLMKAVPTETGMTLAEMGERPTRDVELLKKVGGLRK